MAKTKIEWTDESWNPVTGCTKIAAGCKNCYAERMSKRLAGRYGYPDKPDNFKVTLHPDRIDQPWDWKKPRMVFVCSMGDLFHEDVPDEFIQEVFWNIEDNYEHTFQILTKRPERMYEFITGANSLKYIPVPNVWLGTSISTQEDANENIPWLLKTPSAIRFVSAEPLLGAINFQNIRDANHFPGLIRKDVLAGQEIHEDDNNKWLEMAKIDWVIVAGESGPGARPMNPRWATFIQKQCQITGTKFFFKGWGYWCDRSDTEKVPQIVVAGDSRTFTFAELHEMTNAEGIEELHNMYGLGKKKSGCELNGRVYHEIPELKRELSCPKS